MEGVIIYGPVAYADLLANSILWKTVIAKEPSQRGSTWFHRQQTAKQQQSLWPSEEAASQIGGAIGSIHS